MWRVVNFRSFLFVLLCSSFTIVALSLFPQWLKVLSVAVLFVCVLVMAILNAVDKNAVKGAAFFIAAIFIIAITVNYVITVGNRKSELTDGAAYGFSGRIESVVGSENKTAYIVGDVTADGVEINGNVYLSVEETDGYTVAFLRAGDVIKFSAELSFRDAGFKDSSYYFRNDIRYTGYVSEDGIDFVVSQPTFFQCLRNKIRSALSDNLGEYAEVAYGMFVGEKNGIDDDVRDYYSASGLGHILAVSGLHIGFVTLIVSWITKKLKAGKTADLIANAAVLVFYCFLASFSASVVRASIMCIVGKLAMTLGKQRDTLNSLCFALSVILLVWPYSLFDVGFQMSAAAVFGILLFAKRIERMLSHFLPSFVARPISVSTAAQIGITPVMLYHFHTFPTYSIISNLICAPLISLSFIVLTVALVLALIVPSLGIVLSFAALPLALLDDIARIISMLPMSSVNVFAFSTVFILFVLYFIISPFFMMPRVKWLIESVAVAASLALIAVGNVPFDKSYDMLTASAYKDVTVIVRREDKNLLIGDVRSYATVEAMMTTARVRSIDAVYLTSASELSTETLEDLNDKYGIGSVYVSQAGADGSLALLAAAGLDFFTVDETHESKYGISLVYNDEAFVGYEYEENGVSVLILGYGKKADDVPVEVLDRSAVIRCYAFSGNYADRIYLTNYENGFVEEAPLAQVILKDNAIAFDLSTGRVKELVEN